MGLLHRQLPERLHPAAAGGPVGRPAAASRCPRCGHLLAWFENIPVVSFLVLRGRCRKCGEPISWQYPIIEIVTCAVFVAATLQFGLDAGCCCHAWSWRAG